MSDLTISIEGKAESQTRLKAQTRQFSIIVDQPPALGGDDMGANPIEYLLASFAGCVNVMAHLIAKEMGIKLEKLTIKVDGNINPDRFLGTSMAERSGYKDISMKLEPVTNASPELLEKWVNEIKRRCPINDNLSNPTPVTFSLS
jgi:uncharacterized OsmC-like protein